MAISTSLFVRWIIYRLKMALAIMFRAISMPVLISFSFFVFIMVSQGGTEDSVPHQ
jgi:hypothetical protein